jgi:serine kinase of HPr protein (carbohydrate metabolism regulator)
MIEAPPPSETLHASCVAKGGRAILIFGRSGSGKSDLALRLIDRGAQLVSDDYTLVRPAGGALLASAPATIQGKIEMRGVGIIDCDPVSDVPVCLVVGLDEQVERMPIDPDSMTIAGLALPLVAVSGLEASAPLKVEAALERFGLAKP